MSQRSWVRLISSRGEHLNTPVAAEVQSLFYEVAKDADPRATVKAKLRYICTELGGASPYPAWRAHDGFYGRAKNWSYAAVRDLQARVLARRDRRAKAVAAAEATERLIREQRDAIALAAARAEHVKALAQIDIRLAVLGLTRGGDCD